MIEPNIEECKRAGAPLKRLSINLPARVFEEIQSLAEASQKSMTELVRYSFAIAQIAHEEADQGNKIAIINRKGKVLKEIVLPR